MELIQMWTSVNYFHLKRRQPIRISFDVFISYFAHRLSLQKQSVSVSYDEDDV